MKNATGLLIFIVVTALFSGCLSQSRDVSSSNGDFVNRSNSAIKIKSVFPATPVVTKGGTLKLTSVVTDEDENYLESTVSNPITVTWESSDESVATVDESGYIYGVAEGSAEITIKAEQGTLISNEYKVTVNVVNLNVVDVAEVYLSLSSANIDLNAERKFRLTAVDYSGTQTSLSEGSVAFELSNDNVAIDNANIELNTNGAAVEITLTGQSKGYSFVTPVYSITEAAETIKITGTPLIVQVKDPAESSKPNDDTVVAGNYLSMYIQEDEGKKLIHVGHYDQTYKSFKYSYFDGTWDHDQYAIPQSLEGGIGSRVVLSPFSENRNRPMAIMLEGNKPVFWYQTWPSGGWLKETLNSSEIFGDTNSTYTDGRKLLDVVVNRDDENSSLNLLHVTYFNNVDDRVCLMSFSDPRTATHNDCFTVSGDVKSLSISVNDLTGEPRVAYIEENSAIKYVTRQGDSLYMESVTNTTGEEEEVVIKLDGNNVPTIVAYSGIQIGMYTRKYVGGSYVWTFRNVSGLDPIPQKISSLDFAFDSYNEPRIVFSSDDKIRYARRTVSNGAYKWIVDSPGDSTEGVQGEYSSIYVDSSNRSHIVYSVTDSNWFTYWAEPNFFDYRVFPQNTYIGADVIGE